MTPQTAMLHDPYDPDYRPNDDNRPAAPPPPRAPLGDGDPLNDLLATDRMVASRTGTAMGTATAPPVVGGGGGAGDPMRALLENDRAVGGTSAGAGAGAVVVDPYAKDHSRAALGAPDEDDVRDSGAVMLDLIRKDRHADAESAAEAASRRAEAPSSPARPDAQSAAAAAAAASTAFGLPGPLADLYAVDVQVGHASAARGDAEDVSALMDLLEVDRAADRALRKKRRAEAGGHRGTFEALLAVDRAIDGAKGGRRASEGGEFVDPFTKAALVQAGLEASRAAREEGALADVSELLVTDQEVDGCRRRREELEGVLPLMKIDRQFGANAERTRKEHDVSELADLIAVDRAVDAAKSTKQASVGGTVAAPQENLAAAVGSGLHGVLAELFAVDCQFRGANLAHQRRDDISAIVELQEVDREIDRSRKLRQNEGSSVRTAIEALLAVDRSIDGAKSGRKTNASATSSSADFFDPFTKSVLVQAGLESTRAAREEGALADLSELLGTDREVDGHRRRRADLESILPLLEIDRRFGANAERTRKEHDVAELADLIAVDRAVDAARSAKRAPVGSTVAAPQASLAVAVGSGLDGVLAELFAVDCQFGGANLARQQRDDISAIAELLEVDREVDRARKLRRNEGSSVRAALEALLAVDRGIDGAKSGRKMSASAASSSAAFFDPFTKSAVGQLRALAARAAAEERALTDVAELLEVDREIDNSCAYSRAVESLGPMYRVDRFVDKNKGRYARHRNVDALADLLAVDREIDAAKKAAAKTPAGGEADPMAALLAVDRLIDGKTEIDRERAYLRGIAELVKVDRMMARLSLPLAGSLEKKGEDDNDNVEDIPAPPTAIEEGGADGGNGGGGRGGRSIFSPAERRSAASYEARVSNAVGALLGVDRAVDRGRGAKSRGAALKDVADLLAVDQEVDGAKRAAEQKEADQAKRAALEGGSNDAPAPPKGEGRRGAEGPTTTTTMTAAGGAAAPSAKPKRSIFSTKEKKGAAATGGGGASDRDRGPPPPPTVVLGTTTVVRRDGKMIGSIPVGEHVDTRRAKEEFFGADEEREMARPSGGKGKGGGSSKGAASGLAPAGKPASGKKGKKKKDGCAIM